MRYARMLPHINIEEFYFYDSVVGEGIFSNFRKSKGILSIDVIFGDGKTYTVPAHFDLNPHLDKPVYKRDSIFGFKPRKRLKIQESSARIGYLLVENEGSTNVAENIKLYHGVCPIDIPINDLERKINNMTNVRKKVIYDIKGVGNDPIPFEIRAQYVDEGNNKSEGKTTFNLEGKIIIKVICRVPEKILKSSYATNISLNMKIYIDDFDRGLRIESPEGIYDPINRVFYWEKIPLYKTKEIQEIYEGYVTFSGNVVLKIKEHGKFCGLNELKGEIGINIKNALLSGFKCRFFDATGRERIAGYSKERVINTRSVIKSEFTIDLLGVFKRKEYTPTHTYIFEGVIPSKERDEDIIEVLTDFGISIKIPERENNTLENNKLVIYGRKMISPSDAKIIVEAVGKKKEMERIIRLEGGYSGKTLVQTGEISVILKGTHVNPEELNYLFSKIGVALKERFERHAVVG